jgi:hypothetical protein
MSFRLLPIMAVILFAYRPALADEAMAKALGFPKGFDPVRDAARQEAKLQGGNAAKIERDAKRWQAQQGGAAAASPASTQLALRQRIALSSVAKRRAMLARGNAQYAARNAVMTAHVQAALHRSLERW